MTATARAVLGDVRLAEIPFEYSTGRRARRPSSSVRQDEYGGLGFVSPGAASPSRRPYELYAKSLQRFEQKCGLRDYLDLYQLLGSVVQRGVAGDVAEFGSYKGHSGWLIGTTLKALASDKPVHLFRCSTPSRRSQPAWTTSGSGTHQVQLDEVRGKLSQLDSIKLHPGEFERTLPVSGIDTLALAYVDCDSYRAVSYLAASCSSGVSAAAG